MKKSLLPVLFVCVSGLVQAQKLQLKNISAGRRVFEVDAVGNNPLTITPFLKNPNAYIAFIKSWPYNSLYGTPGIQHLYTYYLSGEFTKTGTGSRFWKKHTLQAGLLLTGRLAKSGMAVGTQHFPDAADTAYYEKYYTLQQKLRFAGATLGINRRFRISNGVRAFTGFHLQGSIAITHRYKQGIDSISYTQSTRKITTTPMGYLQGTHFFQWQAMIPLGIEINLYKHQWYLRAEGDIGFIGGQYRGRFSLYDEAHGAGLWLVYQLQ